MNVLLSSLFKIGSLIVWLLPRRLRLVIGDIIGILWFDVFRIRRRVALENLQKAFPQWGEAERIKAGRDSLRNMGRTIVEFGLLGRLNRETIQNEFELQGTENIDEALARGKGVLFLGLHLGNGDLGIGAISARGYKVNLISKFFKNKALNDLWFGVRAKFGTQFISPEKSSFDILKALKRNEIVIFVLDQFMGPPVGVRTQFFGHETGTAMGLAIIAERTGSPVIPSYSYRKPDGKHVAVFEKPIVMPLGENDRLDEGRRDENIARMTQAYTDKLEQIIRLHPGQWMWIHRRWKEFRD